MRSKVKGYFWIAYLALGALCAWLALDTVMSITGYSGGVERPTAAESAASGEKAAAPKPYDFYRIIPKRNLFGPPEEGGKEAGGVPAERPRGPSEEKPSTLKLRLVGTTLGSEGALAIIEDPDTREQRIVRVGDELEGARITGIKRAEVTLLNKGREEVLKAFREEASEARRVPERGSPPFARALNREQLRELFRNLENLETRLRAVPNLEGGVPRGVRVIERNPPVILSRLGLRNGDTLISVNGRPLMEEEDVAALFWGLLDESEAVMEIERGGRGQSLRLEIR